MIAEEQSYPSAIRVIMLRALNFLRNIWLFRIRYSWVKIGRNVHCQSSTVFWSPRKLVSIGCNVGIGANCTIQSDLKIGANVLIADAVAFLHRREHNWDLVGLTIWDSGRGDSGGIVIEDDVWVGHGAILLGPINIGRGSIIGAGSVVTKDVVSYSIVAGVPAKLVKMRFSKEEIRVHENKIYNPSCLKRFM